MARPSTRPTRRTDDRTHPPHAAGATRADEQPAPENASTGQLIGQLTEQISRLVRDEARLAQAEVTQKAKRLGVGAGLFGGAGLFAFLGLAVLDRHRRPRRWPSCCPAWLAALIVAVVLFADRRGARPGRQEGRREGARRRCRPRRSPSVQADIATVKESARR